jgi:hypothetical protein
LRVRGASREEPLFTPSSEPSAAAGLASLSDECRLAAENAEDAERNAGKKQKEEIDHFADRWRRVFAH